jgi:two-component system chemotaxis sensor kinase CheA
MKVNDEAFLKELQSMFQMEAEEHIKALCTGLLDLEKMPVTDEQGQIIETIYREAHSLKGASRAVNLLEVEQICQALESVLACIKRHELELTAEVFDTLHKVVDNLSLALQGSEKIDVAEVIRTLDRLTADEQGVTDQGAIVQEAGKTSGGKKPLPCEEAVDPDRPAPGENPDQESPERAGVEQMSGCPEKQIPVEIIPAGRPDTDNAGLQAEAECEGKTLSAGKNSKANSESRELFSETVRISTRKLDSLLLQVEEMLSSKLAIQQHTVNFQHLLHKLEQWRKEYEKDYPEIKVRSETGLSGRNDEENGLARINGFLQWNQEQIKRLEEKVKPMAELASESTRMLQGQVDNMMKDIKQVLMLPFSTLLKMCPKVVRDISRDQGKKVELITRGSTTEVDRRILEEMQDPLIHLMRNCIDHGIEIPEERRAKNKPEAGRIIVSISQISDSKIEIRISDDGAGIDPEAVKKAAVHKGNLTAAEAKALSMEEQLRLVFQSDVSTSPIITDISGRGLGLAIVREKVEKLGGEIFLETQPGESTTFRLILPVTLSTSRGILIRAGGQTFVVPTAHVERVVRVPADAIRLVKNRETVHLNGETLSYVLLTDVLNLPVKTASGQRSPYRQLIILKASDKIIAFGVDQVLNEQEVLVKSMGKQLIRVQNISGATILGNGKVVAILNVSDLMKTAVKASRRKTPGRGKNEVMMEQKSVLVAEDSITSRILIRNILESAGYQVKTAVDGMEAFNTLQTEDFDIVVSDIEMPRMDGFDLVSQIRSEAKTADLPVVLVTALESREDREKGIDVGANAYIVKRSFEQSNLLDVVQKLI